MTFFLLFDIRETAPDMLPQRVGSSIRWVSGGWGQTLFGGAQQQDKGQRAQTEAEEVPSEHEEELLYSEGDGALEQAAREVVESPLEIFKTCLAAVW